MYLRSCYRQDQDPGQTCQCELSDGRVDTAADHTWKYPVTTLYSFFYTNKNAKPGIW